MIIHCSRGVQAGSRWMPVTVPGVRETSRHRQAYGGGCRWHYPTWIVQGSDPQTRNQQPQRPMNQRYQLYHTPGPPIYWVPSPFESPINQQPFASYLCSQPADALAGNTIFRTPNPPQESYGGVGNYVNFPIHPYPSLQLTTFSSRGANKSSSASSTHLINIGHHISTCTVNIYSPNRTRNHWRLAAKMHKNVHVKFLIF